MPRMLIVEDEADVSEVLTMFFRARGYAVRSVFSGEEALDAMAADPPEVVLVDILLPGLSGMEVLKRVKQVHPDARVVMVTGLDQTDLRAEARLYGAAGYVLKPFDFSEATWAPVLKLPPPPPPA
jgi:DNA-binding response OmpR family regulator